MTQDGAIREFVREILGCGCPEEVFNKIEIRKNPEKQISGELVIGDRLFIRLIESSQLTSPDTQLIQHVKAGIADRDKNGFNRFRLVIASENPTQDQKSFSDIITRLESLDEKAHVHVLDTGDIPLL